MKIGVAVYEEDFPSETAKEFYNKGIMAVELQYNEKFTAQEMNKLKNFDMDLSLHCPLKNLRFNCSMISFILNNPKFYFTKSQIRNIEEGFLVAEKLEATHYVMHGGVFSKGHFRFKRLQDKDKITKAFIKAFKPFFMRAKNSKVKVVLENLTRGNLFSDVSDIIQVREKFSWLGFCLDFGHSEIMRQTDLLKKLKIDYVHVSDNNFVTDSHLVIGKGKLDFTKLKKILAEQRFKGKVLAEGLNVKDAIDSFDYLREYFK